MEPDSRLTLSYAFILDLPGSRNVAIHLWTLQVNLKYSASQAQMNEDIPLSVTTNMDLMLLFFPIQRHELHLILTKKLAFKTSSDPRGYHFFKVFRMSHYIILL